MSSTAAYTARVGGLAVVLGIGTAVAAGHGVAAAEPTEGAAATSDTASTSSTAPEATSTADSREGPGASDRAEPPSSHVGNGRADDGEEQTGPDTGHAESEPDDDAPSPLPSAGEAKANGSSPAEPGVDDSDDVVETPPVEQPTEPDDDVSSAGDGSTTRPPVATKPAPRPQVRPRAPEVNASADRAPKPAARTTAATAKASAKAAVAEQVSARTVGASSSTTAPTDTPVAVTAVSAQAPAPTAGHLITGLLSALGFGPRATNAPAAPTGPLPMLLGALEWMRREVNRIFYDAPPVIAYNPADNRLVDGTIVGKVTVTDPDDTEFTFTGTTPAHGALVVNFDGSFAYTPDDTYDGEDSFAITVSTPASGLSRLLSLATFGLLGGGHTDTQAIEFGGYTSTTVVSGLTEPTDFRFLPDGRIIFVEKGGAIKVADANGQLQATPVITLPTETHWARGLFAVETDPDFEDNGYLYVSYVTADNELRLSRLTITDPSAEVLTAAPTSEVVLVQGDQPAGDDHLGGGLAFGPDGKLYWSVGDNVCCSVVDGRNSQDLSNIYGKVLRLNPDGTAPSDNPFVDTPGANPLVYATGFRNPYRLAFTPDGTLLVGDVGHATWEELNLVTPGANYGWPHAEGPCDGIGTPSCSSPSSYTNPIYAYRHPVPIGTSSITAVLGTGTNAAGQHTVLIADFNRGWVKELTFNADYSALVSERVFEDAADGSTNKLLEGPDGSIYQLTYDSGTLTRIARAPAVPTTV